VDDKTSPLLIDVHSHIFNGTDLQAERFISLVASRQVGGLQGLWEALGPVLQALAWVAAPSGADELAKLDELRALSPGPCEADKLDVVLRIWRNEKYLEARRQLEAAFAARAPASAAKARTPGVQFESLSPEAQAASILYQLPDTYERFRQQAESERHVQKRTIYGYIFFVIEHFQYRYVSAHNYLFTYDAAAQRKVDLLVPSLVDYDWWLNDGAPTPTSIPSQVDVMERVAILTGGRVHPFVPFDPYRLVAYKLGHWKEYSPLGLLDKAVKEQGAIGVKLYPPMGFAPLGNGELQKLSPQFWHKSWLGPIAERADFGVLLDEAMEELFAWAIAEDVPIMAHANRSNGPAPEFEKLGLAEYWKRVLTHVSRPEFGRLRVNFGHFGDIGSNQKAEETPTDAFLALMSSSGSGERAFADASFLSGVLDQPEAVRETLVDLFQRDGSRGAGLLPDRLMYGSDWKMLLTEGRSAEYLADFAGIVQSVQNELAGHGQPLPGLLDNFLGKNAARFLGLRSGEGNRDRLSDFYRKKMGNMRPTWSQKVDSLPFN